MFRGSIVALVTPMHDDGSVDNESLEGLVNFHIENGTDAIVAVGTTGESATLSHKEHIDVVKQVVSFVKGKIPVIAGCGSNSTAEAIELTLAAQHAGADASLQVVPYYNKPTQEGMYLHFKSIADAVAMPHILYNVPGRTVADMLPDTVDRLSHISNIVAIKEATGDLERAKHLIERCGDRMDMLTGDDATALEFMLLGGKGDISVTANVAPKAMHLMCQAAIAGDRVEAERLNQPLLGLHKLLFVEANPIPVKWAVAKMGLCGEHMRLPMTPLSSEHHEAVAQALSNAGISL